MKTKRKSKATLFTSQKFRWLEQVARDHRNLPPLAGAVSIELCHHFDLGHGGAAWPWQDTLATALGVRREAVNKAVKALVASGHLTSTRQGRHRPNAYHFVLKDEAAKTQNRAANEPSRCAQSRTSSGGLDVRETRFRCAQLRTDSSSKTPEASKEASGRERERSASALIHPPGGGPLDAAPPEEGKQEVAEEGRKLEIFLPPTVAPLAQERAWGELRAIWQRPWVDDDEADRRAFDAACQQAAPEDIIEAAKAWVAAADHPRFLKPLAKWLGARGWELVPPRRQQDRTARRGTNGAKPSKPDLSKIALLEGGYREDANGDLYWPGDDEAAGGAS